MCTPDYNGAFAHIARTIVVQSAQTPDLCGANSDWTDVFHKLFHSFCEEPVT
jgi:hypothetical protein